MKCVSLVLRHLWYGCEMCEGWFSIVVTFVKEECEMC